MVAEIDFSEFPIMFINISGDLEPVRLKVYADELKDKIESLREITRCDLIGAPEREIQVDVDLYKMESAGLTFYDIDNAIHSENMNMTGGEITSDGVRRDMRLISSFKSMDDIRDIVVMGPRGNPNYLRDIATVTDGLKEQQNYARLNKHSVITLSVIKKSGENLIEALNKEYKDKVIFYSSGQNEKIRDKIKYNFDQNNKYKEDEIRILITTDVLAEGINLHRSNIVINYDLPWNPTRVMQRVGRVNRVGSEHKEVRIFNFFPTAETDAELGLEDNIIAKIQAFHNALGEDAQYLSDTEEFTSFNLDGTRRYYKKMNSAETFEDDGEENIELKYLKVIRDLRDKNTDLYCKIKTLPKKIRTGRFDNNIKKDSLITFFRKGKLKKFCITQGLYSEELAFDEAVRYYECEENSKKQNVPKEYYEYLEINRNLFDTPSVDDMPVMNQRGGKSNEKEVISILKSLQRDARFTQEELEYINLVLKAFNDGLMPKKIAQKLKKQIEVEVDNLKVLPILRHNIPNEFIYENTRTKDNKKLTREIVLSEFLIRSNL